MIGINWEDFWWNNVTGPNLVVQSVGDALLEKKMVILKVPSDLPWRHFMRGTVEAYFRETSRLYDVVVEQIDISDENPERLEPGRFILRKYANARDKRGYREKSRNSIQEYIYGKGIMRNRIVWIKGLDGREAQKWIDFCTKMPIGEISGGLFVIEANHDVQLSETPSLKLVDFSKLVSSYDVQLFNSILLEGKNHSSEWKRYISTCSATVCDTDAEISKLLIDIVDFRKESILDGLKKIVEMGDFKKRGAGNGSEHVLGYYRKGDLSEINHRIWSAQIKVLFPIIEMERIELITKYKDQIQGSIGKADITQYGDPVNDALDVELGSLYYLMNLKNDMDQYYIQITDADRKRIRFLRECRNDLAHLNCCSTDQLCKLLD